MFCPHDHAVILDIVDCRAGGTERRPADHEARAQLPERLGDQAIAGQSVADAKARERIGLGQCARHHPGALPLAHDLERVGPARIDAELEIGLVDEKQDVGFRAALGSMVPVDHLQIVCDGKVAKELELRADRKAAYVEGKLPVESSGWCILRAFSDKAEYPILDLYPYATTSPVYVNVAGVPQRSTEDAAYLLAWMERLISAAESSPAWNTETEKQSVLAIFERARQKYEDIAKPRQ